MYFGKDYSSFHVFLVTYFFVSLDPVLIFRKMVDNDSPCHIPKMVDNPVIYITIFYMF